MIAASLTSRRHHPDLQPLAARPDPPVGPTRRRSTQGRGSVPSQPTAPLPSPSIIAARSYYLELSSPIAPEDNAIKRQRILIQGQQVLRRHSVIPTTGNLISQLENLTFSSAAKGIQPVPDREEAKTLIKSEDEDVSMSLIGASALVQPLRKSSLLCGTPQEVLRQVPFQYTHDRLRDWGYAYLGNSQTADTFVNAVSLRRPSLALVEGDIQVKSIDLVTIRARVIPKAKERKPFLIQRQFNIEELRSRTPKSPAEIDARQPSKPPQLQIKHPKSARPLLQVPQAMAADHFPFANIEYALHYLPVLAALMLSGHVRKYDTIDLPLQHPAAWRETVTYVYTCIGHRSISAAAKENIKYLAGHAD
ncbi:hypothetical protein NA56DRAFT_754394 [Hyaloscypha hepaticicola]|uniref:Uncharacterized protein n=1 Tax=Hyaloscypha hepaticicola TaxID=2082293 RepID=A0A2J6PM45_9HELO|nr:hypothetical protein NA56DRAFT_754394 [Hyaloscypha hepaticicola]